MAGADHPELRRSDVLWLLGALTLAVGPHFSRLPTWSAIFVVASFLWRLDLTLMNRALPAKRLLALLALATTAAVYLSHHTLFGRDAGLNLLVLMLSLKLLELKKPRDMVFTVFLGFFVVLSNFLYSQNSSIACYSLLVVWVFTATLVGLAHTSAPVGARARLVPAGMIMLQAAPLMLALFLFFPRLPGPLWGEAGEAQSGTLGMSDTMSPGSMSQVRMSEAIAFQARFEGPVPGPRERYWRGPVLWDYQAGAWRTGTPDVLRQVPVAGAGPVYQYDVLLEPHQGRWLLALDLPSGPPIGARMAGDRSLRADVPVVRRIQYHLTSTSEGGSTAADADALRRALALPAGDNPRARALAREWRDAARDEAAIVSRALRYFREESFYYTLSPFPLREDPVDDFLFNTRSGFCEHYASSFAFLMRAAGIPARVVLGYQGGEPANDGNVLTVRQSDAHAWTEVWLPGQGWVRVDPTAAVAPQRVERGIDAVLPQLTALNGFGLRPAVWQREFRVGWERFNARWNHWVLGYSHERQKNLLARLELPGAAWPALLSTILVATGLAILLLAGVLAVRSGRDAADPVARSYQALCAKLSRQGVTRRPEEGPLAFARRAAEALPDSAAEIQRLSQLYAALRYGRWNPPATWDDFRRGVRALRIRRG